MSLPLPGATDIVRTVYIRFAAVKGSFCGRKLNSGSGRPHESVRQLRHGQRRQDHLPGDFRTLAEFILSNLEGLGVALGDSCSAVSLGTPIDGPIARPTRGITGRKSGSCGILRRPATDTMARCGAAAPESVPLRYQAAVQVFGKLDNGRK